MGNNCWNCIYVNKCRELSPCERFVQFREHIYVREVAILCGISVRTMYRKLKRNHVETLKWIKAVSGFSFRREHFYKNTKAFVLEPNTAENSLKLSYKLKELKEKKDE